MSLVDGYGPELEHFNTDWSDYLIASVKDGKIIVFDKLMYSQIKEFDTILAFTSWQVEFDKYYEDLMEKVIPEMRG